MVEAWTAEDWVELILSCKDEIPLAVLLERMLGKKRLASLVRKHGLRLKGGFRPEKAPATELARCVARAFAGNETLRGEVASTLPATPEDGDPGEAVDPGKSPGEDLRVRLERTERSLEEAKRRLARAEKRAAKARSELAPERRRVRETEREIEDLRAERNALQQELKKAAKRLAELERLAAEAGDRDLHAELHEADRRIAELEEIQEEDRKALAELKSTVEALRQEVEELLPFAPEGRRERARKKERIEKEGEEARLKLLPVYEASFLESLMSLDAKVQRKVHQAIARAVLRGLSYPGLEAKLLRGNLKLWEFRAGISHRVFFVLDGENMIFKHVGTRESLDTFLKRFAES